MRGLTEPSRPKKRKTIAVLVDYLDLSESGYEYQLRRGFESACKRHDFNLLLCSGRFFGDSSPAGAPYSRIYDLVTPLCADGVVLIANLIAHPNGERLLVSWLEQRSTLAVSTIGFEIEGRSSVFVDNQLGMSAIVEHLIVEHGCRKLAFIAGNPDNPEANDRYQSFLGTLAKYGLEFNERRLAFGSFVRHLGRSAMLEIIERGVEFDAVVAANDGMALGAIDALRSKGIRVPRDVAVVGFDDMDLARLADPPLTTVRQSITSMGEAAVQLVAEQLRGTGVVRSVKIPTANIIRESCGCHTYAFEASASNRSLERVDLREFLMQRKAVILERLESILQDGGVSEAADAAALFEALLGATTGQLGAFDLLVEELIERARNADFPPNVALQRAISYLKTELGGYREIEHLWDRARLRVALADTYYQSQRRFELVEDFAQWMGAREQIAAAFDLSSLKNCLRVALRPLRISTYLVSLAHPDHRDELRPHLIVVDDAEIATSDESYLAQNLIPEVLPIESQRRTWVVFPLVFETQNLGFAAFEGHTGYSNFQVLCDQLSAVIRHASLHDEVVQKTMLHERSIQERLATTKRMEALSVLAGGVAHDLNNVLGPMVVLPDVILKELSRLSEPQQDIIDNVVADVEAIRAASLIAARTVRDLLTLGRQGRAKKDLCDLNKIVDACVRNERLQVEGGVQARVTLALWKQPLVCNVAESQVQRALSNIIRNAAEAMQWCGTPVVTTKLVNVVEPLVSYETIDPGQYAVVSVADSGPGIPPEELSRVFEPFFSSKKANKSSGTGLGLAIVHGVVKEHEGFIDVMSAVGQGTTFSLYFPCLASEPQVVTVSTAPPHRRARVLIVDDELMQLRTVRRVLSLDGFEVQAVQSGSAAYKLLLQEAACLCEHGASGESWRSPYDVIIVDMMLNEEQDGLDLFEQIQLLFPKQKCIIASGHSPTERTDLAISRGVPWLTKPYTADALLKVVRQLLCDQASSSRDL